MDWMVGQQDYTKPEKTSFTVGAIWIKRKIDEFLPTCFNIMRWDICQKL